MDVSVIVPCRNEEHFIERCLRSIEASAPADTDMEILVVDGMSEDGTRRAVERLAREYGNIRLLDNPARVTPAALNIGISEARGRYIMRMDAHAEIAPDYIALCRQAIEQSGADNVGGVIHSLPRTNTVIARAVVACFGHRFGAGNAHYRIGSVKPRYVDTVFGGFYRREVFSRIGLFNEELTRGQDIELNLRLKNAGGRTLLVPGVVATYYLRTDFSAVLRHNFLNGEWVMLAFCHSTVRPVTVRHLVPMVFVLGVAGCAVLAWLEPFRWLGAGILAAYLAAATASSISLAKRERDWRLFPAALACFAGIHFSYGLGTLRGALKLGKERIKRWFTPKPAYA